MKFRAGPVVGCDLDGVIGDIVPQLVRFSRTQHRIRLTRKHIVSENLETCAPIRQEQLHRLFENPEFFRSLPVVSGARKSLLTLREAGCAIHIVTDRFWYGEIDEDTTNWLVRHRIPFDSVAFARKAQKQDVAHRLKIDWFIEDQLSNARLLSSICPVLLLDRPYNQGATPEHVTRVNDLQQAVAAIVELMGASSGGRRHLSASLRCPA
jgi:uncharacterized HAD superfamily protein